MLRLGNRLSVIADMVKAGSSVCDVGTDHGYLPAFLYLSGKCAAVTATDINERPLENARENCARLGADGVRLMLCDGLSGVTRNTADTVIIAGMGGEVISGIISRADFLRDSIVSLILQPMTAAAELRRYLAENGFEILKETAVWENGKIYSVMQCGYAEKPFEPSDIFCAVGALDVRDSTAREYIEKQRRIAVKCAENLATVPQKAEQFRRESRLAADLQKILEDSENGV